MTEDCFQLNWREDKLGRAPGVVQKKVLYLYPVDIFDSIRKKIINIVFTRCAMLKVIALLKADIENLYRKYGLMMKNLAKSILGDYQYAEDAVQEALISLSANMDKMDDLDSSRTKNYIYTVTKNKALSMRKKTLEKNRENVQFYDEEEIYNIKGDLDIKAFCDERGLGEGVLEILSSLNELDRDILIYRFADGYSVREVAEMTGHNPDFVYKRIQRAVAKLRKELE